MGFQGDRDLFGDFDNLVEVISEAKSLCAGLFVGVAWEVPRCRRRGARVARADDYGAVAFRFDAVVAGSNAEERSYRCRIRLGRLR